MVQPAIKWEYVRFADCGGYVGWVVGQPMYRIFISESLYYLGFWGKRGIQSLSSTVLFWDRAWVRVLMEGVPKDEVRRLKDAAETHFASSVFPHLRLAVEETRVSCF